MIYEEQLTLSDLHDQLDQKEKDEVCDELTIGDKKRASLTYQLKRVLSERLTALGTIFIFGMERSSQGGLML